ncbi:MAG: DNA cytosine methyltransferase [Bacteroidales bacterium]|nr:DNA cytosine methyltransferase [Bacteroidales bacterium]
MAKKLQPKVVVAENVKGLLLGDAIQYVRQIYREFDLAGYYCQHWLLDASKMGVPQRRERVFFIALRKDLAKPFLKQMNLFDILPEIKMEFNEPEINYGSIKTELGRIASKLYYERWTKREPNDTSFGDITERLNGSGSCFSDVFAKDELPLPTITSKGGIYDFENGHFISDDSFKKGGSYPLDYDFKGNKVPYLVGMSVPPVMTANIATEIYSQWLSKLARS